MPQYPGEDLSPATVPDVVGLIVDDARAVAAAARVALAQPDPDGPPPAALTWRTGARVTSQHPSAGTTLRGWESVVVTWDDGRGPVQEPRRPPPREVPGPTAISAREPQVPGCPSLATAPVVSDAGGVGREGPTPVRGAQARSHTRRGRYR